MRQAAYAAIAYATKERMLESRGVARRKVIELAADVADILAHEDPAFNSADFFRACGFRGEQMAWANDRTSAVVYAMLARAASDPGENETHQGYKNYETFTVCLALDDDQDLQAESISVAIDAALGENDMDAQGATALREWFEETQLTEDPEYDAEDLLSGPASSLLNSALGEVDWLEVAQTRLKIAGEQLAGDQSNRAGGRLEAPIQTHDAERTELVLRAAGRCAHQTGYGLPWLEYCGNEAPCTEHPEG